MSKAAILGAGPTSLYVMSALIDCGIEYEIFTDKVSPPPTGRTWFGWVPPLFSLSVKTEPVYFVGLGTKADYMAKMGRPVESPSTFPEGKLEIVHGYNPVKVVEVMMDWALPFLHVGGAFRYSDVEIKEIAKHYDYVFVTFPTEEAKRLQPAYVKYDNLVADEIAKEPHPNMVIYNGELFDLWTRYIMMFGVASWEFSHLQFLSESIPEAGKGTHWETTVDFGPGTVAIREFGSKAHANVHLTGRWATWDKTFRVDMAYDDTMAFLNNLR